MCIRDRVGEVVRDLGLDGQFKKQGTPSMGGIIILASIIIPTLLFAKIGNIYIILMLITTVWLGLIGFLDDYIKIFKKNKEGLAGRFKVAGQIVLGIMVGLTLFFSNEVRIVEKVNVADLTLRERHEYVNPFVKIPEHGEINMERKSTKTTIPFVKNNEFDYAWLVSFMGNEVKRPLTWIVFVIIVIFIV